MDAFDVVVRGGGAVGLTATLALARQGLSVGLQAEPVPVGHEDVRTYALNPGSVRLLETLKVWDAMPPDARTPVYDMHIEGDDGASVLEFSAWQQGVDQLTWIVDAGALEATLREGVRFAPHVASCPPDHAPTAPLTVLAEGKMSATRKRLGVEMPLVAYGHLGVAARLHASQPHGGVARQWFRSPDVLALLPFDRPHPGSSYGLVWSLPQERAREMLALPAAAFEQALMEATGGAAGALELVGERASWPLFFARAERVCGPGWVLIGDAAHVVHPLAGQGLNLGLADVASLERVIADREPWRALGDEILLRRHARARELPTRAMGDLCDGLLHLFASQQPAVRELRNRGLGWVNRLAPLKRFLTSRALQA